MIHAVGYVHYANETSIVTGSEEHERCEPCAQGYWPTSNRTTCYKLKETYIEILSVQALLPIGLSILGNLLTLFVVILFYKKRETPVVKASGKELCFIMLAGIHLCYLMTFPILLRPHVITCNYPTFRDWIRIFNDVCCSTNQDKSYCSNF